MERTSFSPVQYGLIAIYVDDEYLEYGRVHAQLSHAREDAKERERTGFVLRDGG